MKTNKTFLTAPVSRRDFGPGDAICDITASGRYWRTSKLQRMDLILPAEEGPGQIELSWVMEREADEYDMLLALAESLEGVQRLITFNGLSFDLPHLHHKYSAFRLPDPLMNRQYTDLYRELGLAARFFALPGRRLSDFTDFLLRQGGEGRAEDDAQRTLLILGLLHVQEFLEGAYSITRVEADGERLLYTLSYPGTFPVEVSVHDASFHLRFAPDGTVLLSARSYDGMLRYYHTDVKNYAYLPAEGYAIHKSASAFVDRSRREPAVRENCFHLVRLTEDFAERQAEAYLKAVLAFLRSR